MGKSTNPCEVKGSNSIGKVLLLFLLIVVGCKDDTIVVPTEIIPQKEMGPILADMILVEAVKNLNATEEFDGADAFEGFYLHIFEEYGYSKAQFDESFAFYQNHPELMAEIYKISSNILKNIEEEAKKKTAKGVSSVSAAKGKTGNTPPKTLLKK